MYILFSPYENVTLDPFVSSISSYSNSMKKLVLFVMLALLASCKKQNQSTSFLQMKVDKERLPLVTDRNTTPLMLLEKAIKDGDIKAAGMLLKSRRVDPNTPASTGETLTVFAFKQNQYKIAQLLLIEGNNGDYYNSKGDLITIPGLILDKYIGETEKSTQDDINRDLELFAFSQDLVQILMSRSLVINYILQK